MRLFLLFILVLSCLSCKDDAELKPSFYACDNSIAAISEPASTKRKVSGIAAENYFSGSSRHHDDH